MTVWHVDDIINVLVLALVAYNPETVIPAIELAAAESNALYGPRINFNYTIFLNPDTDICDDFESVMSGFLGEFFYRKRPSRSYLVILATGCSYAMINAGELSREWNIPMIASAGSDTRLRNKKRYPTLVCFLPSQISEYSKVFKELLDRYKWRTVTFICDPASSTDSYFRTACKEFPAILRKRGEFYTVYDFVANLTRPDSRVAALRKAKMFSRVIVILAHMDLVRLMLVTASDLGMTTTDYIYITSLLYNFNTLFWGNPHWFRNDSEAVNKVAKSAFDSLFIVTMAKPQKNEHLRTFLSNIANRSLLTFHSESALAEEKQIYSICGHTAFRAAAEMINETISLGKDLTDGAALARNMYNRSFASVEGNPYQVNANGDRDSLYAVVAMTATGSIDLEEVLFYDAHERRIHESSNTAMVWIRQETVAVDRPVCGFSGEECHPVNSLETYTIALVVAATVAAILLLSCVTFLVISSRLKRAGLKQWFLVGDYLEIIVPNKTKFSRLRKSIASILSFQQTDYASNYYLLERNQLRT